MAAVSRWPLDEGTGTSVGDSVGSNTGTLNDASGWSAVVAPTLFANTNSLLGAHLYQVDLANAATLGVASSYSFSMWIRWTSLPGDRDVAFGLDSVLGDFDLGIGSSLDSDNKIGFDVGVAGLSYQSCKSAATIVAGDWYHVAVVLRNGSADLYVNGTFEATCTYDAATLLATDNAGGMIIGSQGYEGSKVFALEGYVDDVRTFDHELSGAEIAALAARSGGGSTPVVSLTASTVSIAENGGVATIYATLDSTASASVTVGLSVSGVAATGTDYNLSTTSITIASGQTSGSITATAVSDSVYEGDEAFTIAIASVTGGGASASSTASTSEVTIIDDDFGNVYLTSSAVSVAEANASVALVAVISATESATVNVILSLSGVATSGSDYSFGATTISIASGATSGSVSFTTIQDVLDENTETVIVDIASVSGAGSYTSSTSSGWLFTIADDDATPTVSVSASTASIVENGGTAFFLGTLSAASGRTASATVNFATGTATQNTDFTASTNAFYWPIGATSASIGVTSISDVTFEANETIVCLLSTFQNSAIGSPFSASIAIVNEYLAPFVSLSRSTSSITENSGSAYVIASLDHTHSQNVTVVFGLAGTANSVSDYSISTNSIVIASGASSGSISITALQDSVSEAPETVVVSISSVTNGTAASAASTAQVTIVDDDVQVGVGAMSGMSGMNSCFCDGGY